jgi:hypothetical protein
MGSGFKSKSIQSRRRGGASSSETSSPPLAELERRFAQFRRDHPRGTRVSVDLKEAALAVMATGVAAGAISRTCGVSWSQLMAWKGARRSAPSARARRGTKPAPDVRVFSVVDEPVDREAPALSTDNALELRLGPWSISVRLTEPTRTERR